MKKWFLVICFVAFIGVIVYYNYQNYSLGSREEREELLVAVMFDLFEVQALTKQDVHDIQVFRSDAGVYPYFYNVLVTLNNGKELSYKWGSKEKDTFDISIYGE